MNILIITQKIDQDDAVLGFMHRWIERFAKDFNHVEAMCLQFGALDLPANVNVFSLGKERGFGRIHYVMRFYQHIVRTRHQYDAVFVHMNQEYVLLGALLWRLMGKKVTMWRNHHAGSFLTRIAVALCHTVFCTSDFSYTAQFKKTLRMPVGIDTDIFTPDETAERHWNHLLFLARMAPVKRPHILIDALALMESSMLPGGYKALFVGDPLPKDEAYYATLKKKAASIQQQASAHSPVVFAPGISNTQTPALYRQHGLFLNLSSSGMYDKTIFEAMACGSLVLASNKNLKTLLPDLFIIPDETSNDPHVWAKAMTAILNLPTAEKERFSAMMRAIVVEKHSLQLLTARLKTVLEKGTDI